MASDGDYEQKRRDSGEEEDGDRERYHEDDGEEDRKPRKKTHDDDYSGSEDNGKARKKTSQYDDESGIGIKDMDIKVISKIRQFKDEQTGKPKFSRGATVILKPNGTLEQQQNMDRYQQFVTAFKAVDTDNSGTISKRELYAVRAETGRTSPGPRPHQPWALLLSPALGPPRTHAHTHIHIHRCSPRRGSQTASRRWRSSRASTRTVH